MRFELATPLVFANILRWMAPDVFRQWELNGGVVGTVTAGVNPDIDPTGIRVEADGEGAVPFTANNGTVRFFTATPGKVRVFAGDREMVFSLTLPDVADAGWEPPEEAIEGQPSAGGSGSSSRDIWQLLALAGALGLIVEWVVFGRGRPEAGRAVGVRSFLGDRARRVMATLRRRSA